MRLHLAIVTVLALFIAGLSGCDSGTSGGYGGVGVLDAQSGDVALAFDTGADAVADGATTDVHDTTSTGDGGAKVCVPTESKACICVTGAMGVSVCKPDQSGWGLCACSASTYRRR